MGGVSDVRNETGGVSRRRSEWWLRVSLEGGMCVPVEV